MTCSASSKWSLRLWQRRKGSSSTLCPAHSLCSLIGACFGVCCRTWYPTRSNTRSKGACWWDAGAGEEFLRIDVCDTGLGIPATQKQAIFREFHRLDRGAKVARGLGLGLSIVERIARVLDHKLAVELAVGRGSRFSAEVPRSATAPVGYPQQPPREVDRAQLSGMSVLCVDNDLAILDGMESLLAGWGCSVLKATELASATQRIAQAKVSVDGLLVDYHLDHGDGIATIRALRRRFGADLSAILITADRSPGVREEARANDIQVLNKPLKPAALRALLAQWRLQRVAAAE